MMNTSILQKYNVPGPRYTSYPTVPYWNPEPPTQTEWLDSVKKSFRLSNSDEGISLYIHLPYCESLCTYCGCNTRITINHAVERPYIEALLQEWQQYLTLFEEKPRLRELHLGGGTPTFFSPDNLKYLLQSILDTAEVMPDHSFGFEGHPQNTTPEHLQTLFDLGFNRVSFGIQDFDPLVQKTINRIQTVEQVEAVTRASREIGYSSINFDLIFGLPKQTEASIRDTMAKVQEMRPDRIAFYSYAHVPWVKPGQRSFSEADLPQDAEKRRLYEVGKMLLEEMGYVELGMDHFALPSDSLTKAFRAKKMHRNFMGYTEFHTRLMVGLGASSISDSWEGFVQNRKRVEDYMQTVEKGEIPFFRGHILNREDLVLRRHILNLMCHFETSWEDPQMWDPELELAVARLGEMAADGLVEILPQGIRVTGAGEPFVRNVCMALDARLARKKPGMQIFSKVV